MKTAIEPRLKQETPTEMVDSLMTMIRGQFYADLPPEKWFKDRAFIQKKVVLWPATWLNARGLTLSTERYQAIVLEVVTKVKQFAGAKRDQSLPSDSKPVIRKPSGYLKVAMLDHFRHNDHTLHEEAKAFTRSVESAVALAKAAPQADPVVAMATAAALINPKRRVQGGPKGQGELF